MTNKRMKRNVVRVAVLIETSTTFSRGLVRGILRFAKKNPEWRVHILPGGQSEQQMPDMKEWGASGLIARVTSDALARKIVRSKLPCILLNPENRISKRFPSLEKCPEIQADARSIVEMALNHFFESRLENFGYVRDTMNRSWSIRREKAMIELLESKKRLCHLYLPLGSELSNWKREHKHLTEWLFSLPKPIGLLAASDYRARQILDACRNADVSVPNEVAVLGVDNDSLVASVAEPPLSSVALNTELAGYEAASCLARMMRGKMPRTIIKISPVGIVKRQSTDVLLTDDPLVAGVLNIIRERAVEGISVSQIASRFDISRRRLEIRFKKTLGRTIRQEIERCKMEHVKRIIHENNLTLNEIARMCFFSNEYYLSFLFRKHFGICISQYKKTLGIGVVD